MSSRKPKQTNQPSKPDKYYTGFDVYHMDATHPAIRNPIAAKDELIAHLGIQPLKRRGFYDGHKDGYLCKFLGLNAVLMKRDTDGLIDELTARPVDRLCILCMSHEDGIEQYIKERIPASIDFYVSSLQPVTLDDMRGESDLLLAAHQGMMQITGFSTKRFPKKEDDAWKGLISMLMIDWDYNGQFLRPTLIDAPDDKNQQIGMLYSAPAKIGRVRIKVVDIVSNEWIFDVGVVTIECPQSEVPIQVKGAQMSLFGG